MSTFGITRVKDEADIIEGSIRRMLRQVDHIIIGWSSTDGTREVLEDLHAEGLPLTLVTDDSPGVAQRDVMTSFAQMAAEMGATWVLPYDTDEIWLATGRISARLAELPQEVLLVHCPNLTHCCTDADPDYDDSFARMGWRSVEKLPLPKVACRILPGLRIDHGNHSAKYSGVPHAPIVTDLIEIRHFPYRTPEQFIKRVQGAWPQLRDSGLPEGHGAHMRGYGRVLDEAGPDGLRELFEEHMRFSNPATNPDLVFDPCP